MGHVGGSIADKLVAGEANAVVLSGFVEAPVFGDA